MGLGLSAIVFLPVVYAFLGNSRLFAGIINTDSLIVYEPSYYLKLPATLVIPRATNEYYVFLNFTPPALLATIALLFARKPDRTARATRIALFIVFACLMFPIIGKLFNGFGYVTNRWSYAVALVMCFAVAKMLPDIHLINGRRRVLMFACVGGWIAYSALIIAFLMGRPTLAIALLPLIIYAALLLTRRRAAILQILSVFISLAAFIALTFGFIEGGYTKIFTDRHVAARIANEVGAAAREIDDNGFYRVTQRVSDDSHARIHGYKGLGYYLSIVPAVGAEHVNALGVVRNTGAGRLFGLGNGAALNELAAVKYYLLERGVGDFAPYGYDFLKTVELPDGDFIDIYENRFAPSVGYVFSEFMTAAEYDCLNPVDKRAALMRAAVVDSPIDGVLETDFTGSALELDIEILRVENIDISGEKMRVNPGGLIEISFDAPEDCEIYVVFEDMRIADAASNRITGMIKYGERESGFHLTSIYDVFGYAQSGVAVCVGAGGADSMAINISPNGDCANLECAGMRLYAAPISDYERAAKDLQRSSLKNIVQTKNRVSGDVALESADVLQIAIPYSKGWTALVDGERAEILPCGGMYMGIALTPGEHHIILDYATPYLGVGAVISLISLCALIIMIIFARRRRGIAGTAERF